MQPISRSIVSVLCALACYCLLVGQANREVSAQEPDLPGDDTRAEVDRLRDLLRHNAASWKEVAVIDHSRLAGEVGVAMPPSVVSIFSDPSVNTPLIQRNQRIGIDLPVKVLAYEETNGRGPTVAYVPASFVRSRHSVPEADKALASYEQALQSILEGVAPEIRSPCSDADIEEGYGIVEWKSDYPFNETISRLKSAILSQGDTVWFGEVDYTADARKQGTEIRPTTLLLFGGPGPGGKSDGRFPKAWAGCILPEATGV